MQRFVGRVSSRVKVSTYLPKSGIWCRKQGWTGVCCNMLQLHGFWIRDPWRTLMIWPYSLFFFHTDSHQHAPHSLPIPEVEDMSILKVIAFQRSPGDLQHLSQGFFWTACSAIAGCVWTQATFLAAFWRHRDLMITLQSWSHDLVPPGSPAGMDCDTTGGSWGEIGEG